MKVVVIGDVSWGGNYHLGDEAMTEVAIQELRRRGAEVTLIAGDPAVSAPFYGVEAVPRFGFRSIQQRQPKEDLLAEIMAGVRGERAIPEAAVPAVEAVKNADAVVIGGGGNLNSSGQNHIYERLTLKRLAEHFGIPLFVSSQTVGPHLAGEDRPLIHEIASYARVFGAREGTTAELVREIVDGEGTIVHTMDDALLLEPAGDAAAVRDRLGLPGEYVVGSFTLHSWSTGLTREQYYRKLAVMLDQVVEIADRDIVLLPHMGSLSDPEAGGEDTDAYGHRRIAHYMRSDRVHTPDMISARVLLALTADADFTLSTRYHPVIFGSAVGVPAIGIVTSYYSAVRMRGALHNVGMEQFAVPYEGWTPLFGERVLAALAQRGGEIRDFVRQRGEERKQYQSRWWDGIVAEIAGTGSVVTDDMEAVETLEWADDATRDALAVARVAQEGTNLYRLNASLTEKEHERRIGQLERDLKRTEKRLAEALQSLEHAHAEIRHLRRPPGAAIRDKVRIGLRNIRKK